MTTYAAKPIAPLSTPTQGYDLAAPYYDAWLWSRFWDANEAPIVAAWLRTVPGGRVLDVGCGTGRYLPIAHGQGLEYIGVDISREMLAISRERAERLSGGAPFAFHLADLRDLPVASGSVDALLCNRVLTHVADLKPALREFGRVLNAGGLAIVTDVHSAHPYEHTTIRLPNRTVRIETYKHTPESLRDAVKTVGAWEIVCFEEVTPEQLRWNPPSLFPKIQQHPDAPVFYSLVLRKR